ncbi:general secretion pathway protein E [Peptoclostridium acidaminophilum DSM 3953]|uniref:General secretion pathway protein E n=1 Tax=Peptoclostridium acidaminophilum DSM 3953 TaxID=1286171 RepID=W8U7S6_PEPAC|nr:GspE/PulE family protein [Peptoclostridium acidaminophilum]AHM56936.1 general secretion pathway protein E [Peptoclostridium acidaminophilum DSM 3953]
MNNNVRLGDILLKFGKITAEELENALDVQKRLKKKLGEVLIELGYVTDSDIIEVLEHQLGIHHFELDNCYIEPSVPKLISEGYAIENQVIPVKLQGGELTVAMSDPFNIIAISQLERMLGFTVIPAIATKGELERAIQRYFSTQKVEKAVAEFRQEFSLIDRELEVNLNDDVTDAPIVRLVDSIIMQAVQNRASDIHIEPSPEGLRIRFRIDGELVEVMRPDINAHGSIVTRIKIMSKLNIAEKRVPQDGRIEVNDSRGSLDLRISTIPTIYGEKVVIRVLDNQSFLKTKDRLGLSGSNRDRFEELLRFKNGLLLVTGPTGSGKSTTLYAALADLNDSRKNIVTVEDPVEYRMSGINQIQVNPKTGLTFSTGLRSILRQDPDIIMIGEIRDTETAEIAIRAAITGHLVLSTLHTNDAASSISRLLDMDIKPYLVSSSLKGIVAQRLVRKVCQHCVEDYYPAQDELQLIGGDTEEFIGRALKRGRGCKYCNNTGYKGRISVYEILIIDNEIRKMIFDESKIEAIKEYARRSGMVTLQQSCRELILDGTTTTEEYMRVMYL